MKASVVLMMVALVNSPLIQARSLPKPAHRALDPQGLSDTIIGAIDDLAAELHSHGVNIPLAVVQFMSGQGFQYRHLVVAALDRLKAQLQADFEIDGDAILTTLTSGTAEEQDELLEQYYEVYVNVFAHLASIVGLPFLGGFGDRTAQRAIDPQSHGAPALEDLPAIAGTTPEIARTIYNAVVALSAQLHTQFGVELGDVVTGQTQNQAAIAASLEALQQLANQLREEHGVSIADVLKSIAAANLAQILQEYPQFFSIAAAIYETLQQIIAQHITARGLSPSFEDLPPIAGTTPAIARAIYDAVIALSAQLHTQFGVELGDVVTGEVSDPVVIGQAIAALQALANKLRAEHGVALADVFASIANANLPILAEHFPQFIPAVTAFYRQLQWVIAQFITKMLKTSWTAARSATKESLNAPLQLFCRTRQQLDDRSERIGGYPYIATNVGVTESQFNWKFDLTKVVVLATDFVNIPSGRNPGCRRPSQLSDRLPSVYPLLRLLSTTTTTEFTVAQRVIPPERVFPTPCWRSFTDLQRNDF
ncbi:hypothetical protein BV898_03220 [Hypsibius exemplaris]|uniref:Secreted protein n=1 Tax=Hypsibius exemplaris TaxID=2072580 RepID=A0A1W0X5M5_HYPEX|nr:hypothetical protein BV898_03220 [Hypsibius exemplaris]